MRAFNSSHCHSSCRCDCHQSPNTFLKGIVSTTEQRLHPQPLRKSTEAESKLNLISSGSLENTMSSNGSNWRNQPQLARTLLNKRRPEELSHSYEVRKRATEDISNYTTYQQRTSFYEDERRREEQLKTEANELRWENESLLFELEKMTKEKNSAVAMTNSLRRVLKDYSGKTKLQCGDETWKNVLLGETNELKEINSCYHIALNLTFEFLKYVAINEGIEMKNPLFYIQNNVKCRLFLQRLYQSLYGKKEMPLNKSLSFNSKRKFQKESTSASVKKSESLRVGQNEKIEEEPCHKKEGTNKVTLRSHPIAKEEQAKVGREKKGEDGAKYTFAAKANKIKKTNIPSEIAIAKKTPL